MADLILTNANKSVSIITSEHQQPSTPSWFSELIIMSHLWTQSGLLSALNKSVRVVRGKMGLYEVIDFVLLLLAYGLSNERTLKYFFKVSGPFQFAIAALWDRDKSPGASALSRFLSDISSEPVEALRELLFKDLLQHGIKSEAMGGLYDHTGKHHIVFDVDATKEVARQRSIPTTDEYPSVNRRRKSCAPGYTGRKGGEVVRTRTTIEQAHTHEWLGTFGDAGNGDIWKQFHQACKTIVNSHHSRNAD